MDDRKVARAPETAQSGRSIYTARRHIAWGNLPWLTTESAQNVRIKRRGGASRNTITLWPKWLICGISARMSFENSSSVSQASSCWVITAYATSVGTTRCEFQNP